MKKDNFISRTIPSTSDRWRDAEFRKAFQADLRINYEKYFYDDLSLAKESEQDKFVMELMVRF